MTFYTFKTLTLTSVCHKQRWNECQNEAKEVEPAGLGKAHCSVTGAKRVVEHFNHFGKIPIQLFTLLLFLLLKSRYGNFGVENISCCQRPTAMAFFSKCIYLFQFRLNHSLHTYWKLQYHTWYNTCDIVVQYFLMELLVGDFALDIIGVVVFYILNFQRIIYVFFSMYLICNPRVPHTLMNKST